ncbi:MAG: hypothetical protein IKZ99_02935, partial [Salinivirgaceae bacterium]|nr:hypothetical protein [Salinivirgaceae bacterium]
IDNGHIIKNTKFLYGWDIYFEYNNNYFLWYGNPNETDLDIYLMEKKKNYYYFIERTNPTKNKHTDADNYFCFKVTDEMYEDDKRFLKALDKLIREKKKDEKH